MNGLYKFEDVLALLEREAIAQGEDPLAVKALAIAENTATGILTPGKMYKLGTTSPKGAVGVGQVMPATQQGLVAQGLLSGESTGNPLLDEVRAMVAAVKEKRRYSGDDPVKLAIAYNAGQSWLKDFDGSAEAIAKLPKETQDYLQKVGKNVSLNISTAAVPEFIRNSALAANDALVKRRRELLPLMSAITGEMVTDGEKAKEAVQAAAEAKAASIRAEAAGVKHGIDAKESVLKAWGLDVNDPNSILIQRIAAQAKAHEQTQQLAPQIAALREISFLENPIGWIQAQIHLERVVPKFNNAAAMLNNSARIVGSLQQQAAQQLSMMPASTKAAVDAKAKADAEVEFALAKFKVTELSKQQSLSKLSMMSTELQHMGIEFSDALALAKFEESMFEYRDRKEAKTAIELEVNNINRWRTRAGAENISPEQFKLMDAKERAKWIKAASTSSLAVANTPGEALNWIYELGSVEKFKERLGSDVGARFVDDYYHAAANLANSQKFLAQPGVMKLSDDERFIKAANDIAITWRKETEDRQYDKLSKDNPLRMNAALFAKAPELKNNKLAQAILLQPNQGAGLGERQILELALGRVYAGEPAAKVAQDFTEFFRQGNKFQHAQLGLSLLGINMRNQKSGQVEYPIDGNIFGFFDRVSDPRRTNPVRDLQLLNPVEMENFFILHVVRQKAFEAAKQQTQGFSLSANPMMFDPALFLATRENKQ